MAKVLQVVDMYKCIGCYSCMLACARTVRNSLAPSRAAMQIRTAGGFQGRFVADICLGCMDAPCAKACNWGALTARAAGGVHFQSKKCIGCKDCIDACIVDVLFFDEDKKQPLACIQCGTCAAFCPHNVIAMEERKYVQNH